MEHVMRLAYIDGMWASMSFHSAVVFDWPGGAGGNNGIHGSAGMLWAGAVLPLTLRFLFTYGTALFLSEVCVDGACPES